MEKRPKILFLSAGDSTRGLMAEGFLKNLAGEHFQTASAAIEPGDPHPLAFEVMNEVGIDLSEQKSKTVAESLRDHFSYVIVVYDASRERSPIFPFTPRLLRWSLTDPSNAPGSAIEKKEMFRRVRDEIHKYIQQFLNETGHAHQDRTPVAA